MAPVQPKTPAESRVLASMAPVCGPDPSVSIKPGIALFRAVRIAFRATSLPLTTKPAIENATHRPAKTANSPWKARPLARIGPRSCA